MSENYVERIKEHGIVGAGGAGFPTHVKINTKAEYVVVNGAECEPLIRVDQQLMALKAKEIVIALEYVRNLVEAKKAIIGLKGKYKDAIKASHKEIVDYPNIEVFELGNFYPAGDEQILVYETLGRIVPEGGIPLNVGVVVLNVETLLNIYETITNNTPVTDKYITVGGHVRQPMTVKVPIGISFKEVIALADGTELDEFVVINGGPMMGGIVKSLEERVTKSTKALLVLPKDHSLVSTLSKDFNRMLKEAKTACMHCSLCSEVCPRNLIGHSIEPHKLIRLASYNSTCEASLKTTTAFLCCECRLCEYACVMALQPWKLHALLKSEMSKVGIRNPHHNEPEGVHPFRSYKRYPVSKLIKQLGLSAYDVPAPMCDKDYTYNEVGILLKQHIGAPTTVVVEVGQVVEKGQVVGQIEGTNLGANVHASISGCITEITNTEIKIQR